MLSAAENRVIYFALKSGPMDFCDLHGRLLQDVKRRVSGGEITERSLARATGISQPHMHNVLKGIRDLTPLNADRILRALRLTICDLLEIRELKNGLDSRGATNEPGREIPVVTNLVGAGSRWPVAVSHFERFHLAESQFRCFRQPLAARLAPDPAMADIFAGGELIILETGLEKSSFTGGRDLVLIELDGGLHARYLRVGRFKTYVLDCRSAQFPLRWETKGRDALVRDVKARIHFREHLPQPAARRRPPGTCGALPARSVAS